MKSVFILWHIHKNEDQEDEKLVGVYSSNDDAQEAIKRMKIKPGFQDFPDSFQIDEYEIGKDNWPEGFVTVHSQ